MIIYKTTNNITGKIYIGKDKKNNPKYLGSGLILRQAIKKYGKENFTKVVLEHCSDEQELDIREKFWIKHYQSTDRGVGYNLTEGGTGGDTFSKNPNKEIIRSKMGQQFKGKTHSQETKEYLSEIRKGSGNGMYGKQPWNKGIPVPDDVKKKISDKLKGKFTGIAKSDYVKQCVSKAQLGVPKSEEHKKKISAKMTRINAARREKLLAITHKICIKCKLEKSVDDFYKEKNGIPRSYCKKCHNL